ncbi:MAG TPA: IS481 family transposase [Steroidobacteraceae bacterium]|nr:IS481 family transposase [Steroidobacteraceae bacterium]
MEEKVRFVYEYERDERTMRDLCASFGVSRETGYVWLRRYRQLGLAGLVELNRAPRSHPNQTEASVAGAVIELRQAHMRWGPRKLKRILERDQPGRNWPATSTVGEIVRRAGLVVPRKMRRRTEPYTQPLAHAVESNRVWCADFKGWFKAGDGTRIDPLTITDACSRYLLRCQAVAKTDTARVQAVFEAAFREYGLPETIRTDNGAPFASSAVGGLSRLAVWWIKLGIHPERIQAGHPEQNGRHERMHRTLKQDLHPAEDWRSQQLQLDRFRKDYNQVRPHEALEMQTPASVYEPSPRPYPARIPEVEYPDTMEVRTVKSHGHFRWKKQDIFLTEVLWGEPIGLLPIGDGLFNLHFAHLPLIGFDSKRGKLVPLNNPGWPKSASSRSGQACPDREDKNKNLPEKEKVSGMCPV